MIGISAARYVDRPTSRDWRTDDKQADFLGKARLDLSTIEPFNPQTFIYQLKGKRGEEGKFGELRLRMVFKPDYVTRSRQGSSTFHGSFAAPGKLVTGVAGAPLKVGGFAVGGLAKGASFLKKSTFGRAKSNTLTEEDIVVMDTNMMERQSTNSTTPHLPISRGNVDSGADEPRLNTPNRGPGTNLTPSSAVSTGPHHRTRSSSSQFSAPGVVGSGPESGAATVRLISASGYPLGANVQIRIRPIDKSRDVLKSKSIKTSTGDVTFDESVTIQCFADQQFKIWAKDDHLFKDKELGEGLFVVDDTGSGQDTVVQVGEGRVTLKTSFKGNETASNAIPKANRKSLLKRG